MKPPLTRIGMAFIGTVLVCAGILPAAWSDPTPATPSPTTVVSPQVTTSPDTVASTPEVSATSSPTGKITTPTSPETSSPAVPSRTTSTVAATTQPEPAAPMTETLPPSAIPSAAPEKPLLSIVAPPNAQYKDGLLVVEAGENLTLKATGLKPDRNTTFTLRSDPIVLGIVKADAHGIATLTRFLPSVPKGIHSIDVTQDTITTSAGKIYVSSDYTEPKQAVLSITLDPKLGSPKYKDKALIIPARTQITLTATGFQPDLRTYFKSNVADGTQYGKYVMLGETRTDPNGQAKLAVTLPSDLPLGSQHFYGGQGNADWAMFSNKVLVEVVSDDSDYSTPQKDKPGILIVLPPNPLYKDGLLIFSPGDAITVKATGLKPDQDTTFTLHSDPIFLGTVKANADGVATLTTSIPMVPTGIHRIDATQAGMTAVAAEIYVTTGNADVPQPDKKTPEKPGGNKGLPNTGAQPQPVVPSALLITAGCVLLAASRRKQPQS